MRRVTSILIAFIGLSITAIVALADDQGEPERSGEAVFTTHCANCHTGGIGGFFSGAPDIDDPDDWEALTPKGLDALTASTIAGIGEMVARGACTTCTDEEIRVAVEYMLEASQP